MDAEQALAFLTEISSQIQGAVVFDESGKATGSTLGDEADATDLARRGAELFDEAARLRGGDVPPTQLEIATGDGSVFVVRDGKLRIVATTTPRPTTGLVFYDLKSALREIEQKPRRTRRPKEAAAEPAAPKAGPKAAAPRKKKPSPRKKPDAS
jgi:predicted regulator of Ras-like GTPase activity (Roadblock/LC7/MglB family)